MFLLSPVVHEDSVFVRWLRADVTGFPLSVSSLHRVTFVTHVAHCDENMQRISTASRGILPHCFLNIAALLHSLWNEGKAAIEGFKELLKGSRNVIRICILITEKFSPTVKQARDLRETLTVSV